MKLRFQTSLRQAAARLHTSDFRMYIFLTAPTLSGRAIATILG
ncbi:hypothetical protein [Nostoc sp. LEGE 06077]|nr:hypothetical protein [Nostoc sp. LEGE 06077]